MHSQRSSPLAAYGLGRAVCCLDRALPLTGCSGRCLKRAPSFMGRATCYLSRAPSCMWRAACCLSHAACCLSHVACCLGRARRSRVRVESYCDCARRSRPRVASRWSRVHYSRRGAHCSSWRPQIHCLPTAWTSSWGPVRRPFFWRRHPGRLTRRDSTSAAAPSSLSDTVGTPRYRDVFGGVRESPPQPPRSNVTPVSFSDMSKRRAAVAVSWEASFDSTRVGNPFISLNPSGPK